MKSLILLLFVAISLQAQSLPEAARKERQRQANEKPKVVFTGEKPGTATSPAAEQPAAATKPAGETAKPAAQAPAVKPAPPKAADDAAKRYAEEVMRLRAKIVELQDRDTLTQLQLNDLRNQFLAPVTDSTARAQAETKISQTQIQLQAIEKELANTRHALQVLESQGPPKP